MKKISLIYILMVAVMLLSCDQKKTATTEEDANNATSTAAVPTSNESQTTPATTPVGAMAKFEFAEMQHDFGNLKEGEVVKHTYKFKNVGDAPLVISNVQVQCGCTTPSYTKTPVPPNGEGTIELQFDSSGKSGPQHKTATVMANVEGGQSMLVLTAVVASKPKIDGPFLKQ
jgi:hypothetical protein